MFLLALQAAAWRVPFLPTRVGLGSDLFRDDPSLKTVTDPYQGEELVAVPALHLDAAIVHLNRCDERGNAAFLGPDLYFDDLLLEAAAMGFVSCEKLVTTARTRRGGPAPHPPDQPHVRDRRGRGARTAPTPPRASPTTTSTTPSCAPTPGRPRDDGAWEAFVDQYLAGSEADYQEAVR